MNPIAILSSRPAFTAAWKEILPDQMFHTVPSLQDAREQGPLLGGFPVIIADCELGPQAFKANDPPHLYAGDAPVADTSPFLALPLRRGEAETLIAFLQQAPGVSETDPAQIRKLQKLDGLAQFHSGLAHDINNRMTTLLGNLSILEALVPDEAELIADMSKAADECSTLIRMEQTYCKRDELPPHPVNFTALVQDLYDLLDRTLGNEINLDWNSPAETAYVQGDEGLLEQVIVNMFLETRVRLAPAENPTLSVHFAIDDGSYRMIIEANGLTSTGTHWPIDEPNELSRGLAVQIARDLVDQHRGTLQFEDGGTHCQATLELPRLHDLGM